MGILEIRYLEGGDRNMKALHMTAYALLWVGGFNWGLVGLFQFNLVETILGAVGLTALVQIVYILVGLSAVYTVSTHMGDCKVCGGKK